MTAPDPTIEEAVLTLQEMAADPRRALSVIVTIELERRKAIRRADAAEDLLNLARMERNRHRLNAAHEAERRRRVQLDFEEAMDYVADAQMERDEWNRRLTEAEGRLAAVVALCTGPVDGEARSHVPVVDVLAAARGEGDRPTEVGWHTCPGLPRCAHPIHTREGDR